MRARRKATFAEIALMAGTSQTDSEKMLHADHAIGGSLESRDAPGQVAGKGKTIMPRHFSKRLKGPRGKIQDLDEVDPIVVIAVEDLRLVRLLVRKA